MTGTITFDDWIEAVNALLERELGCGTADLPDLDYCHLYDDGATPLYAARKAVRNAGGGGPLD